jgi:RimJ/RimL family protein N-acetyltransferase
MFGPGLGAFGPASHLDWRDGLPLMATSRVMLREPRKGDAAALLRLARLPEIAQHTWPPPDNVEAFERFIEWARTNRAGGTYACFVVVPKGHSTVAGMFELRALHADFFRAELAGALDPQYWGTGVFVDCARLVCDFAFNAIGVHRIEARAEVDNGRANGALRKLGATQEGRLRGSFVRGDEVVDQYIWSIINAQ